MAQFAYTALDARDAFVKGVIVARHSRAATAKLEAEGFAVVSLKRERSKAWWNVNVYQSVSALDRIFFTRNLHTLVGAGIGLDQAVHITSEQTSNVKLRPVLEDIAKQLRRGQTFYSALSRYPWVFSPFYCNLIRVGESSGKLDDVLGYLLDQQERDYDLRSKVRSAMIYPIIIFCALIIMVSFMLVFVIPRVTSVLTQYDVQLPLTTRILMAISNVAVHFGWILFPALAALIFGLIYWFRRPSGKRLGDRWVLSMPLIKRIVIEFNLARFTRSLSSLLRSGLSIDQAIDMSSTVTSNTVFAETIRGSIRFVRKGLPLGEVLKGSPKLFPPMTCRMIEVGERSGKLDEMTTRLAVFYEKSVSTTLDDLSSVIEPLLLLGVGLAVAFVAISVLTPIWKFSATI